jgi:hypothetical protein
LIRRAFAGRRAVRAEFRNAMLHRLLVTIQLPAGATSSAARSSRLGSTLLTARSRAVRHLADLFAPAGRGRVEDRCDPVPDGHTITVRTLGVRLKAADPTRDERVSSTGLVHVGSWSITLLPASPLPCGRSHPVGAEYSSGPVTCALPERRHAVMDLRNCAIHPNRPVADLGRSGQVHLRIERLRGIRGFRCPSVHRGSGELSTDGRHRDQSDHILSVSTDPIASRETPAQHARTSFRHPQDRDASLSCGRRRHPPARLRRGGRPRSEGRLLPGRER